MVTESEFSRLHKTFRGLWTVCIFAVALMFIVSVAYTVPRYLEYPVSYDVAMVTSQKLPFPAVTLCNTNRFRKSEIEDSRFRDLLLLDRPAGLSNLMPYIGPCFHGDFPCDENATECVKHYMKCNGQDECRNGADERDCTGIGEPEMDDEMFCVTDTKFPCNNSKCIPSELTCDYIDNCGDFSDEDNCTYLADCGSDSFQCSSNEGEVHCLPGYLRCDRIKHCRNGEDEDGCEYPTNTGFFDVFAENWTHPYHDITTASRYYDKFREDVYLPNLIDFVSNDTSPSLIPLLLASTSPTFDDVRAALMMTAGEMHQFGHQADDAILECSYNGMECETEDFTVSQHENL
ncbi:uncharacterized protein [Ptychodera flava]|uniref:uncharacterized protein n=1 Tax=Ptychodera flava TaxID=63121 RepID=UPI003969F758